MLTLENSDGQQHTLICLENGPRGRGVSTSLRSEGTVQKRILDSFQLPTPRRAQGCAVGIIEVARAAYTELEGRDEWIE
jgi:hypothetical protein